MEAQTLLAVVAVVVSLAALSISSTISWRQLRSMQSANHLPVAIELLTRDYGQPEFQQNERAMLEQLSTIDPAGGVFGLPEPLLSKSLQVINFYDSIGILVAFGCVEEELVLTTINYRIRQVWTTLEPFVRAERELRQGPYLDILEDLAVRAHRTDPRELSQRRGLRGMPPSSAPTRDVLRGRVTGPLPTTRVGVRGPQRRVGRGRAPGRGSPWRTRVRWTAR